MRTSSLLAASFAAVLVAAVPARAFDGETVTVIPGMNGEEAPSLSIGGNPDAGMFDSSGRPPAVDPSAATPLEAFDLARNAYRSGDKEAALSALQFAAGRGHAGATWMLGRMYAEGDGVTHDDRKAFEYFRDLVNRATTEGADESFEDRSNAPYISNALVWLGSYYLEGIPGSSIKPNPAAAIRLFTDAASNYGDPNAQYNLARIYLDGNGVKKDPGQAVRWLNLAAKKNHGPSRALLGHMMFKGEVVKRQPARGLMLMMLARQSAEQSGAADAQWMIDLHDKALQEASEDERRSATSFLDGWLKARSSN
jgi:uncharacterized protein